MNITEEWLLAKGFTKHQSLIIDSYEIDISFNPEYDYRKLSVSIQQGNQYVFLRQGDPEGDRENDEIITIFNGDYQGQLTTQYIDSLLTVLWTNNK